MPQIGFNIKIIVVPFIRIYYIEMYYMKRHTRRGDVGRGGGVRLVLLH